MAAAGCRKGQLGLCGSALRLKSRRPTRLHSPGGPDWSTRKGTRLGRRVNHVDKTPNQAELIEPNSARAIELLTALCDRPGAPTGSTFIAKI